MQGRLISKLYFLWSKILHSIPILLNKLLALGKSRITKVSHAIHTKHLHSIDSHNQLLRFKYWSHCSIPTLSILALLLLSLAMINPTGFINKTSAMEVLESNAEEDHDVGSVSTQGASNIISGEPNEVDDPIDNSFGGTRDNNLTVSSEDAEVGIMPLAVSPSTSLSITTPSLSTTVAPGGTAYVSSNVTYSASDTTAYKLQVTYASGSSSLKLNGGTATLSGAGTSGVTGSSLANNTWGFGWGATSTANASLKYYTVPAYGTAGTGIGTGRLENGTTVTSTTKKIVFAAKFASNNTNTGHYQASVLLSLVATPKLVLSDISNMQEMTTQICADTDTGASKTLKDTRDNSTYTVTKLDDKKCWMTQNLRLVNKTLTPADSDVSTTGYIVPASTSPWITNANADYKIEKAYYYNTAWGTYYTWCAATAGSCFVKTGFGETEPYSICPKGWRLPTLNEYRALAFAAGIPSKTDDKVGSEIDSVNTTSAHAAKLMNAPYNFVASGMVVSQGLYYTGESVDLWSSTAQSSSQGTVFVVHPNGDTEGKNFVGVYADNPRRGFPVRCIAK